MAEWVVLLNPAAGTRPMPEARVVDALARHRVPARVEVVDGRETMRAAVVDVARSGARLAVVGGDGTVGLAVDALLAAGVEAAHPLGVLPAGTGCDLLRTFGIPQGIEEAAAHLASEQSYSMDVGFVEGGWGRRAFVNVAQAGVGAAAAESARNLPRRLGTARYPLAFVSRLPTFPRARLTVEGASGLDRDALAIVLANGQFFAGGWNIAPKAMLVDGELDVQVMTTSKAGAPALVPRIVRGVHLGHPTVRRRSLASLTVATDVPWPVEADGDHLGSTPFSAWVEKGAVTLKI